MVAALLMEPQPEVAPVCTVSVRRRRARQAVPASTPRQLASLAA
jgi:hypothetical protein